MDYINNSVRKFSGFFSSPATAITSAEHIADRTGSVDSKEELDYSESNRCHSIRDYTSDSEHHRYYDRCPPQPPQKRLRTVTERKTILLNAGEAVRKARSAMGTEGTQRAKKSVEFDIQEELKIQEEFIHKDEFNHEIRIQEELERQLCQEEHDKRELLQLQEDSQSTPASERKHLGINFDDFERTPTSSKLKPMTKSSDFENPKDKESSTTKSWKDLPTPQQWTIDPNRRARELLDTSNGTADDLLHDLQEPLYACRDIEIGDGLRILTGQIQRLAAEHFSFDVESSWPLRPTMENLQPETVKIIGCVASGGPAGAKGWEALFLEKDKRQALICAIIGNVLVEQVFQHLFFGGTEEQIDEVSALQFKHRHDDGFDRTILYAYKLRDFLTPSSDESLLLTSDSSPVLSLPRNFNTHLARIIAALSTHIRPFLALQSPPATLSTPILSALHALTTHAALLSLSMRLHPDTAYHFAPAFKNENFLADEMQCFNHESMQATHPRGEGEKDGICAAEMARREGLSDAERERMKGDEPLVQISIFPGVVAYRRGGFEEPSSSSSATSAVSSSPPEMLREDVAKGFRSRRLIKGWVYCWWGRKRVWVDGQPADDPEVHGEEWNGGFVEFYPGVEGVVNPKGRLPLS